MDKNYPNCTFDKFSKILIIGKTYHVSVVHYNFTKTLFEKAFWKAYLNDNSKFRNLVKNWLFMYLSNSSMETFEMKTNHIKEPKSYLKSKLFSFHCTEQIQILGQMHHVIVHLFIILPVEDLKRSSPEIYNLTHPVLFGTALDGYGSSLDVQFGMRKKMK